MTSVQSISSKDMSALISSELGPKLTPEHIEILQRSVRSSSHIWIGEHNGELLCFFGLIPPTILSDTAYLWLYNTEAMAGHTIPLIRHSIRARRDWLELYPRIVGHGRVGNDRSLAWLRLIGAEFGEPTGPVVPFEIRAH